MISEKQKRHLAKLAEMKRGKPSPLRGRKIEPFSLEHRERISKSRIGMKIPEDIKRKISLKLTGIERSKEFMKKHQGINNGNWKEIY